MLPMGILNFRVSNLRFVHEYVWARNTVWREGAVHDSTSTKRAVVSVVAQNWPAVVTRFVVRCPTATATATHHRQA